jgi:hypothetical protein
MRSQRLEARLVGAIRHGQPSGEGNAQLAGEEVVLGHAEYFKRAGVMG